MELWRDHRTCVAGHAVNPSLEARTRLLPRDGPATQSGNPSTEPICPTLPPHLSPAEIGRRHWPSVLGGVRPYRHSSGPERRAVQPPAHSPSDTERRWHLCQIASERLGTGHESSSQRRDKKVGTKPTLGESGGVTDGRLEAGVRCMHRTPRQGSRGRCAAQQERSVATESEPPRTD